MSRLSDNLTGWALAATGALLAIAAVTVVLVLSASPAAGAHAVRAHSTPRPLARPATSGTVIAARRTEIGTILTTSEGRTLYAFSRDRRNHDACAAIRGCLSVWPPVTVSGGLHAGRGVRPGLLGTIAVAGHRQATYAGHPLYLYVSDADDHGTDTGYVGISQSGGTWPAVAPSGALVR
jgi:predicted lipoprotein with Yx(FWY)xxD motif